MDNGFPVVPDNRDDENPQVPGEEPADQGKEKLIQSSIRQLSDGRIEAEVTLEQLRSRIQTGRKNLEEFYAGERTIRVERARIRRERDRLKARVLELKRSRLQKDSDLADLRSRLREIRETADETPGGEIDRLKNRISDLDGDVAAFRYTKEMHRRDRDRIYEKLTKAMEELQDRMTEVVLTKILIADGNRGGAEKKSEPFGVTAELLGRLLVLEKESAFLGGFIVRMYHS